MKKYKKIFLKILLSLIIIVVCLLCISYIFPGKLKHTDIIRIKAQTFFLDFLANHYVSELTIAPYDREFESRHLISYEELVPYVTQLNTGDVFFTESENYITAVLTPGQWKHSAIYIGTIDDFKELYTPEDEDYDFIMKHYKTGSEILILDGSKEGIAIRELSVLSNLTDFSYMKSCIGFNVLLEGNDKKDFISTALEYYGCDYDYDMNTKDDSTLYCSELLYNSFSEIGINIDIKTHEKLREVVSPSNIVSFCCGNENFSLNYYIQKKDGTVFEPKYVETKN